MMPGFRRAQLRGSEELFRSTEASGSGTADRGGHDLPPAAVPPVRPEGRLVRLTDDDIALLVDALQRLKFPTSSRPVTKPSVAEFERLEELRQKLLDAR
jgi:hypothetical protein